MSEKQPEPRYLVVGRILRPHGVRGELRVETFTDFPERIAALDRVYLGSEYLPYKPLNVRMHQELVLLTLEGCADRDAADLLRGVLVSVKREDAVPLESGEYYHFQLVGLQVETDAGESLGEVASVFEAPGANDVLVVFGPHGEVLLPVISDVILNIDFEARRILVHLLPGLLKKA